MNQILECDWLPKQARLRYPACSELPAVSRKKRDVLFPYNKSFMDQEGWILVLFFLLCLWTKMELKGHCHEDFAALGQFCAN